MAKNTVKTNVSSIFGSVQPLKTDEKREPVKDNDENRSKEISEAPKVKLTPKEPEKKEQKASKDSNPTIDNIFKKKKEKIISHSRSFYLNDEIYAKLQSLAEKQGLTLSETLTTILESIL